MPKKPKDTDYLALSARLHAMEGRLLTRERMERMIDARDDGEAAKVLTECGYGDGGGLDAQTLEPMLAQARGALLEELHRICPDPALVEVFQLKYDYHNAKVLLKARHGEKNREELLLSGGRYQPQWLQERLAREELRDLCPAFRRALEEGREVLSATGDPQMADFALDKAQYCEMLELAQGTGCAFLVGYVRLCIDGTNLRAAVRAGRLNKTSDFLQLALVPGGTVSLRALTTARGEELAGPFQAGKLQRAAQVGAALAQAGAGPLTAFEKLCDDALTDYLAGAQRVAFGPETVIGYLYAREQELTAIRVIVAGRSARLPADTIRGRLRESYV